jgi:hypothetical protein
LVRPHIDATMTALPVFDAGNYRYIKAVFQYSAGVAAQRGYAIERARFAKPLPLSDGFAAIESYLQGIGRPVTAFAACELRSPEPFTDRGFDEFNYAYVKTLERWQIYTGGDEPVNPVARTNVCPMYNKPREAVMSAFSYTVPETRNALRGTFIISGGGEARRTPGSFRERIVRLDDTSPDGMREKMTFVIEEMERRLQLLGFSWPDAVTVQAYTVQNIGHVVDELLAARGSAEGGLVWYYARPPVIGLEYEMDVRGAARELII